MFKTTVNSNNTSKLILKDLASIRDLSKKNMNKCTRKIEKLIFFIVQTLRHFKTDHLLETTVIWVLINLIKVNSQFSRRVMLLAGIPGALYGILNTSTVTGATRKYVTELCSYLSSEDETLELLDQLDLDSLYSTDAATIDKNKLKEESFMESLASIVTKGSAPFKPYSISQKNVDSLTRLFDEQSTLYGAFDADQQKFSVQRPNTQPTQIEQVSVDDPLESMTQHLSATMSMDDLDNKSVGSFATQSSDSVSLNSSLPSEEGKPKLPRKITRPMKTKTLFKLKGKALRDQPSSPSSHSQGKKKNKAGLSAAMEWSPVHKSQDYDLDWEMNSTVNDNRLNLSQITQGGTSPYHVTQKMPAMQLTAGEMLQEMDPFKFEEKQKLPTQYMMSQEVNDDDESLYSVPTTTIDEEEEEEEFEEMDEEKKEEVKRIPKKLRIRAEKLVDHKFIDHLFHKQLDIHQTQMMLKKMQDLLDLIDKESTGYVAWSYFARVLVTLAPADCLREDIETFLDAQVESDEDLINYREFIISGKVHIIEKKNGRTIIPINGWLERQKLYTGDATTYTWKNHQKWYTTRKKEAIVWLMRRAIQAAQQEVNLQEAGVYLRQVARVALSYEFLRVCGTKAFEAQEKRFLSKKVLLRRALLSRKLKLRQTDAFTYLREISQKIIFMEKVAHEKGLTVTIDDVFEDKPDQVGYDRFYLLKHMFTEARKQLVVYAQNALLHCTKRDEAANSLATQAKRVLIQQTLVERAFQWLVSSAQRYHLYCCEQDNVLLWIKRKGKFALEYFDRQSAALPWLINRGRRGLEHSNRQEDTLSGLMKHAKSKLDLLNSREHALAYCKRRRYNAEALIINKIEAIKYLRGKVANLEGKKDFIKGEKVWLKKRGELALEHTLKQNKALRRLAYIGGRSRVVYRKALVSYIDLHQIAQWARIFNFQKRWPALNGGQNEIRLQEEILRLQEKIKKEQAEMDAEMANGEMSILMRWKIELEKAFTLLGKAVFQPGDSVNDVKSMLDIEAEPKLSRIGFLRLFKDGALINETKDHMNKFWFEIDPTSVGFLSFAEIWEFFHSKAIFLEARMQAKSQGKKHFFFRHDDIVSAYDQATFILKGRFAMQEKRIVDGQAEDRESDSDRSEEDDSDEDSDEDGSETDKKDPYADLNDFDRAFMTLIAQHEKKPND